MSKESLVQADAVFNVEVLIVGPILSKWSS
jgi:hypothetical protein